MAAFAATIGAPAPVSASPPDFIAFESGQVRPLALSPDGSKLFATNTPNDTLEILAVTPEGLSLLASVPVGLEPVAVAARTGDEVWVVNHLSDSVSVVSLAGVPHVTRTLLLGDEPRDIVFAGSHGRAFITTAHRGQHRTDPSLARVPGAGDPKLTTPGVPRADVWVFDPADLGDTIGGTPVAILSFFTDTPRALAVSPDKKTVYVAGFKTGNQTTIIAQGRICDGFDANKPCTLPDGTQSPGGQLPPATDAAGAPAPKVAMIVKFNHQTGHWEDELGRVWDSSVRLSLPDTDVFAVDADRLKETAAFAHVGTTLFNMATNPVTGTLYISNTDAQNQNRFEGPGVFAGHTMQGHLAEARITVISAGQVVSRHLNKHLDYAKPASDPGFDATGKNYSLSTPLDIAVSGDGRRLYVAAFGSSKIGVLRTAVVEDDSFDPRLASADYIPVTGGGPSGLALDERRGRLYVLTRFDDAVKVMDLATKRQLAAVSLANPEPEAVIKGRPMLYDATRFSGNGEASCASCHIFGDNDDLAWDLGNPDGRVASNPITINLEAFATLSAPVALQAPYNGNGDFRIFHPMKGPMTTQTLRGLRNSGAMHWRGDRADGIFGVDAKDETLSFVNFAVAFRDLLGSVEVPTRAQMQAFADFQLHIVMPPNPIRNLDNSLTAGQQRGKDFFMGPRPADGGYLPHVGLIVGKTAFTCNGCHRLDAALGQFGTSTNASLEGLPQVFKIPQLRNLYTKVGMFGMATVPFLDHPDTGDLGPQIRGFGFTNEGYPDTLFNFLSARVFRPQSFVGFPLENPDATRRDIEQYLLAFDSDLAPVVGEQVTLSTVNAAAAGPRIDLLEARAAAPFSSKILGGTVTECDLVAKLVQGGRVEGLLFDPNSRSFIRDDGTPNLSDPSLRALAASPGQEITFTCVPPGSGRRIAFGAERPARRASAR